MEQLVSIFEMIPSPAPRSPARHRAPLATGAPIPANFADRHWGVDRAVSDKTVTACVLVIGNEILSGRTQDVNLPCWPSS